MNRSCTEVEMAFLLSSKEGDIDCLLQKNEDNPLLAVTAPRIAAPGNYRGASFRAEAASNVTRPPITVMRMLIDRRSFGGTLYGLSERMVKSA